MLVSLLKNDPSLELSETLVHVEVSENNDSPTYSHSFRYKVPSSPDKKGKTCGEITIYTDKNTASDVKSFVFDLEECHNKDCKEKCCLVGKPNRILVADVFHTMPKEYTLQSFGAALFEALFSCYAGQLLHKTEPPHPNNGIYLQLNRHADLDDIPWEYANNRTKFIVHQRIFARVHVRPSTQLPNLPLRIVAVVPDPIIPPGQPGENFPDLHLREQFKNFINGFTTIKKAVKLERVFPPTVSRMNALLAKERMAATVFHFMGHCGQKGVDGPRALIFENNDNGGQEYIGSSRFLGTFDNLRLAFLSACDSRDVARVLVERGVPYTIGSNCSLPNNLARKFEFEFYNFLASGSTVERAMLQARASPQNSVDSRQHSYFAGAMVFYSSKFGEGGAFQCEDGEPDLQLHLPQNNLSKPPVGYDIDRYRNKLFKLYTDLKHMVDYETQVPHFYTIKGVGSKEFVAEAMERMAHLFPGGIFVWDFDKETTSTMLYLQRLVEVIFPKGVWTQLTEQYGSNIQRVGSHIIEEFRTRIHASCLLILHHAEILDIGEKERNLHALELGEWLRRVASERMNILITSSERLDWCTGKVLDLQGDTSRGGYACNSTSNIKNGIHKRFVQVKEPIVFYGVPPENLDFVERSDILAKIEDALGKNARRILALTGLGGIGKTQLMLRYCYLHRKAYDYVFWLKVDSWNMAVESFRELAMVIDKGSTKEDDSEEKTIQWIHSWFHKNTKWLLLLDNADNDEMDIKVFKLLPRIGGTIILTTRMHIPSKKATVIHIDKMNKKEALCLLYSVSSMDLVDQKSRNFIYAENIIAELDYMPLAIDLARAYVKRKSISFEEYLSKFKELKNRDKLLQYSDKNNLYQYEHSIITVWQPSLKRIQALNPTTVELLKACAFLHPENIPVCFFKRQYSRLKLISPSTDEINSEESSNVIGEAIAVLVECSFATRTHSEAEDDKEDPENDLLTIPRLVQKVIYDPMENEQRQNWADNLAIALNKDVRFSYSAVYTPRAFRVMDTYISHIRHFAALLRDLKEPFVSKDLSSLLERVIWYLLQYEVYFGLDELAQFSLRASEVVCGLKHLDAAMRLENLAKLYKSRGKHDEVGQLDQQARAIHEKMLLKSQAKFHWSQDKYYEVSGENGPNYSYSTINWQTWLENPLLLSEQSNIETAALHQVCNSIKAIVEASVLEMIGKIYLGDKLGIALYVKRHLRNLEEIAKVVHAEGIFQGVQQIVIGDDGQDDGCSSDSDVEDPWNYWNFKNSSLTATTSESNQSPPPPPHATPRIQLLWAFILTAIFLMLLELALSKLFVAATDEMPYATEEWHNTVDLRNQIPEEANWPHMIFFTVLVALGGVIWFIFSKANLLYKRKLTICENVLGSEYPDTATSFNSLAELYKNQGKYDEAALLYQRDLMINEKVLGSEHPDTVTSLNNLAELYISQGKYDEAEPLYKRALTIREKALGSEHPDTNTSLDNLAILYKNRGKYDVAEPLCKRALAIREKVLGSEHPDMTISLNNLAELYIIQGEYDEAEQLYKRALAIREKALGSEHTDTATALDNLAILYKIRGKYDEAEPLYKRALTIREKVLGSEHQDTAASLNNLTALRKNHRTYDGAEPLYNRSLAIREKVSLSAQVKEPIYFYGVPPENFDFVERSDILASMEGALGKNDTRTILVLAGLGGMGKTQMMLRYCYLNRTAYNYIFWLEIDSWSVAIDSFRKLAIELGINEENTKGEDAEKKLIDWVYSWFQDKTQWLLLLNNCDGDEMEERVFKLLPHIGEGDIILTTRSYIPSKEATVINVGKMREQEAILLLFGASSMNLVDQTNAKFRCAQEIARELDYMPLAIILARAYVERTRISFKRYLSILKERRKRFILLKYSDQNQSDEYKYTVATVWQLSFEKLRALNPTTVQVLQICAFLHPEVIPVRLIERQCSALGLILPNERNGEDVIRESIAMLIKYSFVTRTQLKHKDVGEDPATDLLTIHCLVQKVIYDTMDDEQKLRWAHNLATVLNNAIYYDYSDIYTHSTRRIMDLYLSHIRHFVKLLDDLNQIPLLSEDLSSLLDRVIQYLLHHGVYFGIEELAQYSIQVSEAVYGSEHPSTATAQETLAGIYKSQGKYDESEPLYQRALVIREKVLGSEHPDTATSLNSLAGLYKSQGKYDEAELLYQRALAIREKVLGSEHPDTATILGNLAVLYERQGKYDEAEPLYQRALVLREKVLGSEHPDTATTLGNLAVLYFHQGKYDEAELLYRRVLVIKVKVLGPEHPSTAETLNNLAELHNGRGKYDEAEPLYQKALTISEKVLGSDPQIPR